MYDKKINNICPCPQHPHIRHGPEPWQTVDPARDGEDEADSSPVHRPTHDQKASDATKRWYGKLGTVIDDMNT